MVSGMINSTNAVAEITGIRNEGKFNISSSELHDDVAYIAYLLSFRFAICLHLNVS